MEIHAIKDEIRIQNSLKEQLGLVLKEKPKVWMTGTIEPSQAVSL